MRFNLEQKLGKTRYDHLFTEFYLVFFRSPALSVSSFDFVVEWGRCRGDEGDPV